VNSDNIEAESSPSGPTHFVDEWIVRAGKVIDHYAHNRALLYRPFLKVYALTSAVSLAFLARVYVLTPFWDDGYATFEVVAAFLSVVFSLGALRALSRRSSAGLSLFAALFVLMLLQGSVVFALMGIYVVGNSAFRAEWVGAAPVWYRRLVTEYEALLGA